MEPSRTATRSTARRIRCRRWTSSWTTCGLASLSSNIFADLDIARTLVPIPEDGGDVKADYGRFSLITNDQFSQDVIFGSRRSTWISRRSARPRLVARAAGAGRRPDQAAEVCCSACDVQFSEPIDVLFHGQSEQHQCRPRATSTSFDGVGTGQVTGDANVGAGAASMMLLGTGLLGAVGMRRRASRKAEAA